MFGLVEGCLRVNVINNFRLLLQKKKKMKNLGWGCAIRTRSKKERVIIVSFYSFFVTRVEQMSWPNSCRPKHESVRSWQCVIEDSTVSPPSARACESSSPSRANSLLRQASEPLRMPGSDPQSLTAYNSVCAALTPKLVRSKDALAGPINRLRLIT